MLLSLFQNAGIVRYPLLFCSILAMAVILERLWTLAALRKLEDEAFQSLKVSLRDGNRDAIHSREWEAAPVSHVLNSLSDLRGESEDTVGQVTDIAVALQRMRLRRFLGTLATIGSTMPFVGLFGTVLGVMTAFQGMSKSGLNGDAMASGIAEALSATAFGLLVAVPSIVAYNYLVGRIQLMLLHIQAHVAQLTPLYMQGRVREEVRS